jgi:hypothetical protein
MRAEAVEADTLIQAGASATTSPGRALAESRPSHRVRNALVGVGAALGLAAGGFLGLRAVTAPDRSPTPSPSSSPIPTRVSSENPTVEATPSPTPTPEVSANPDAHQQLVAKLNAFVDGKNVDGTPFVFPTDLTKRFFANGATPELAPFNIVGSLVILNQEFAVANFQGYLLGTEEVIDSKTNVESLVADVGFESRSADPKRKNFYFGINLGRIGSNDKDYLGNQGVSVIGYGTNTGPGVVPVATIDQALQANIGKSIVFQIDVFSGAQLEDLKRPDISTDGRNGAEFLAQNDLSKALIAWMEKTVNAKYTDVPMDSLVKSIINKPVTDLQYPIPSVGYVAPLPNSN